MIPMRDDARAAECGARRQVGATPHRCTKPAGHAEREHECTHGLRWTNAPARLPYRDDP